MATPGTRVYVGGLDNRVTERDLEDEVREEGERVPPAKKTPAMPPLVAGGRMPALPAAIWACPARHTDLTYHPVSNGWPGGRGTVSTGSR